MARRKPARKLTNVELEKLLDQREAELKFCHEVIAKLGADFQRVDAAMKKIEAVMGHHPKEES